MKNESKEELIALHALGLTENADRETALEILASDQEAARLHAELQESLGELAHAVDPVEPPASLRSRILDQLPEKNRPALETEAEPGRVIPFPNVRTLIPWSLAACFAIICGLVVQNNVSLRNDLTTAVAQNDLDGIEVATLSSMMAVAPRAKAVAVWDSVHQEGVLTVSSLPTLEPDKDYQLWIIDPRYEDPVSGGVFSVSARGETKIRFKPDQPIETISAYAVSLERKGGVPKAEGPMVLITTA